MTTELFYLALSAVLSLVMWVPYILGRIVAWGPIEVVGYPERELPQPKWCLRLKAAHYNHVENLAPFAVLVLVVHLAGLNNELTALGATIFFFARLVHAVVYALGVPLVRTLAFAAGLVGSLMVASALL